jgi:hypothetical protein
MKKPPFLKVVTACIVLPSLTAQIAFGALGEANIWSERRKALAPTPAAADRLPPLRSDALTSTLASRSAQSVDAGLQHVLAQLSASALSIQDVHSVPAAAHAPVLLFQDVHMNVEAQTDIADALLRLIDQKDLLLVGVEGSFSRFDFAPFRRFPDQAAVRTVADSFFKNKRIAATSYAGIVSAATPPPFVGVDDRVHYDANVQAYLSSRTGHNAAVLRWRQLRARLQERKQVVLNGSLKRLDALIDAQRSGQMGSGDYATELAALAAPQTVPPAMDIFIRAYALEKSLDLARVDRERRQVIDELSKRLAPPQLKELLEKSLAYRSGRDGFGAYYRWFQRVCERHHLNLRKTPAFESYVRYVLLADEINAPALFQALHATETRLVARLATTPEQKAVMAESNWLSLAGKLIDFSLTSDEWNEYKSLPAPDPAFAATLKQFQDFYAQADIRSDMMTKNFLSEIKPAPGIAAGLVVGGFHTPRITQLLREQNIPYVVVSPKLTKLDGADGSAYLTAFAREKTPLERLFQKEKLFLALEREQITYPPTKMELEGGIKFKSTGSADLTVNSDKGPLHVRVQETDNDYRTTLPFTTRAYAILKQGAHVVSEKFSHPTEKALGPNEEIAAIEMLADQIIGKNKTDPGVLKEIRDRFEKLKTSIEADPAHDAIIDGLLQRIANKIKPGVAAIILRQPFTEQLPGREDEFGTPLGVVASISRLAAEYVVGGKLTDKQKGRVANAFSFHKQKAVEAALAGALPGVSPENILLMMASVNLSPNDVQTLARLRDVAERGARTQDFEQTLAANSLSATALPVLKFWSQTEGQRDQIQKAILAGLGSVVETEMANPNDPSDLLSDVVEVFSSIPVGENNVPYEKLGLSIGAYGARVLPFIQKEIEGSRSKRFHVLWANALGRAISIAMTSEPASDETIFQKLKQWGVKPETIKKATEVWRVDLFSEGGAEMAAPEFFKSLLGNLAVGADLAPTKETEAAIKMNIAGLAVSRHVFGEFLLANGVDRNSLHPTLVLGRTFYFRRTDGRLLALKFQRAEGVERIADLDREMKVMRDFHRQHEQGILESDIPTPIFANVETTNEAASAVGELTGLPEDFQRQLENSVVAIDPSRRFVAYVTDDAFTRYAHSIEDDAVFTHAIDMSLHDLAVMARSGVIHKTMFDITHTPQREQGRADNGEFLWNVQALDIRMVGIGTGAMRDPWSVTEFSNYRESGISDFGDIAPLQNRDEPYPLAYTMALHMGNYVMGAVFHRVFQLREQHRLGRWDDPQAVDSLAEWIEGRASRFISAYANFPENDDASARDFFAAAVDWKALARELLFFMAFDDNGQATYYKYVSGQEPWPKNIYPDADVKLPALPMPAHRTDGGKWHNFIPGYGWGDVFPLMKGIPPRENIAVTDADWGQQPGKTWIKLPNGEFEAIDKDGDGNIVAATKISPRRGPANGPFDSQALIQALYVATAMGMAARSATPRSPPSFGGSLQRVRDLISTRMSMLEYSRSYAWWIENLLVATLTMVITAPLAVIFPESTRHIFEIATIVSWSIFSLMHALQSDETGGRASAQGLKAAVLIQVIVSAALFISYRAQIGLGPEIIILWIVPLVAHALINGKATHTSRQSVRVLREFRRIGENARELEKSAAGFDSSLIPLIYENALAVSRAGGDWNIWIRSLEERRRNPKMFEWALRLHQNPAFKTENPLRLLEIINLLYEERIPFDSTLYERLLSGLVKIEKLDTPIWREYLHFFAGVSRDDPDFLLELVDLQNQLDLTKNYVLLELRFPLQAMAKYMKGRLQLRHSVLRFLAGLDRYKEYRRDLIRDGIFADLIASSKGDPAVVRGYMRSTRYLLSIGQNPFARPSSLTHDESAPLFAFARTISTLFENQRTDLSAGYIRLFEWLLKNNVAGAELLSGVVISMVLSLQAAREKGWRVEPEKLPMTLDPNSPDFKMLGYLEHLIRQPQFARQLFKSELDLGFEFGAFILRLFPIVALERPMLLNLLEEYRWVDPAFVRKVLGALMQSSDAFLMAATAGHYGPYKWELMALDRNAEGFKRLEKTGWEVQYLAGGSHEDMWTESLPQDWRDQAAVFGSFSFPTWVYPGRLKIPYEADEAQYEKVLLFLGSPSDAPGPMDEPVFPWTAETGHKTPDSRLGYKDVAIGNERMRIPVRQITLNANLDLGNNSSAFNVEPVAISMDFKDVFFNVNGMLIKVAIPFITVAPDDAQEWFVEEVGRIGALLQQVRDRMGISILGANDYLFPSWSPLQALASIRGLYRHSYKGYEAIFARDNGDVPSYLELFPQDVLAALVRHRSKNLGQAAKDAFRHPTMRYLRQNFPVHVLKMTFTKKGVKWIVDEMNAILDEINHDNWPSDLLGEYSQRKRSGKDLTATILGWLVSPSMNRAADVVGFASGIEGREVPPSSFHGMLRWIVRNQLAQPDSSAGGTMGWMRNWLFPSMSLERYSRTRAWWVENLFAFTIAAMVTAALYGGLGWDFRSSVAVGNAVGWALFAVGHFKFFNGPGRERNLSTAIMLATVATAIGLLPLPGAAVAAMAIVIPLVSHRYANPSSPLLKQIEQAIDAKKQELRRAAKTQPELRMDLRRALRRFDGLRDIAYTLDGRYPHALQAFESSLLSPLLQENAVFINALLGSTAGIPFETLKKVATSLGPVGNQDASDALLSLVLPGELDEAAALHFYMTFGAQHRFFERLDMWLHLGVPRKVRANEIDSAMVGFITYLQSRKGEWNVATEHGYLPGTAVIVEGMNTLSAERKSKVDAMAAVISRSRSSAHFQLFRQALGYVQSIVISDADRVTGHAGAFGHPVIGLGESPVFNAGTLLHEGIHQYQQAVFSHPLLVDPKTLPAIILRRWSSFKDGTIEPARLLEELLAYGMSTLFELSSFSFAQLSESEASKIKNETITQIGLAQTVFREHADRWNATGKLTPAGKRLVSYAHAVWAPLFRFWDSMQSDNSISQTPVKIKNAADELIRIIRSIRDGKSMDILALVPEENVSVGESGTATVVPKQPIGEQWREWAADPRFATEVAKLIARQNADRNLTLTDDQWNIFEGVLLGLGMNRASVQRIQADIQTKKAHIVALGGTEPMNAAQLSAALLRLDNASGLPIILTVQETQREHYQRVVSALSAAGFRRPLRIEIFGKDILKENSVQALALVKQCGLDPNNVQFVLSKDLTLEFTRMSQSESEQVINSLRDTLLLIDALLPVEDLALRDFAQRLRAVLVAA